MCQRQHKDSSRPRPVDAHDTGMGDLGVTVVTTFSDTVAVYSITSNHQTKRKHDVTRIKHL